MKIYTRTGDQGETHLIGGSRVSKSSVRVVSYGSLDELNSFLGLAISKLDEKNIELKQELIIIQYLLFDLGNDLTTPANYKYFMHFSFDRVEWLENQIDNHSNNINMDLGFVLPGGSESAALLHIVRTVSRRAERLIIRLNEYEPVNGNVVKFINRLSDYFL